MHKHHIVFRSQGGLDFSLNFKYLSYEDHEGPNGPHRSRITDLKYKTELQTELISMFEANTEYTEKQIADELGVTKKYIAKNFKRVTNNCGLYRGEDIVRHLMGGRLY